MNASRWEELRRIVESLRVKPGTHVRLPQSFDSGSTGTFVTRQDAESALLETSALLSEYQARLAAQDHAGVLIILQGIDAAGKDGTIKHVMAGVNPAGVTVHSFKVPSAEELSHDFLWRFNRALPRRGEITIFNRSQYEELLVVRVHPENLVRQHLPSEAADPAVWRRRQRDINAWEQYLTANGITVVKLFLNLSKEEQRRRFLERIDEPDKNWKFSLADIEERKFWKQYLKVYGECLSATSTPNAPWCAVPADDKENARLIVSQIVLDTFEGLRMAYPKPSAKRRKELQTIRKRLAR